MTMFDPSRRQVLKGSAAAVAMGAIGSLGALHARQAHAATAATHLSPVPSRYGPLAPVADDATGLPLLQLPRGFRYRSFGWSGDRMDDGQPCPDRHDGMAVVGADGTAVVGATMSIAADLARLEEIVRKLEADDLDLDAALALFEEGVTRLRTARERLSAAELKVQTVLEEAGGDVRLADLDV